VFVREHGRIPLEHRAVGGVLDVPFERHHAVAARQLVDFVLQLQRLDVETLIELGAGHEDFFHLAGHGGQHRARRGREHRTHGDADDGQVLGGLDERAHLAARPHETPEHRHRDDEEPYDRDHAVVIPSRFLAQCCAAQSGPAACAAPWHERSRASQETRHCAPHATR
jgi:hypothetical protein